MSGRLTYLLAGALTVFVLVVVGSVVQAAAQQPAAEVAATPATNATASAAPTDAAEKLAFEQREAAYRDLVEEANARIREANERMRRLASSRDGAAPTATVPPSPEAEASVPSGPITEETAAAIASDAVGGYPVVHVELEEEHGRSVYKVRLADRSEVEIAADSGEVVDVETHDRDASRDRADDRGRNDREGRWDEDD